MLSLIERLRRPASYLAAKYRDQSANAIERLTNENADLKNRLHDASQSVGNLECDAYRYRWLRTQPNNTDVPRIDVVQWEFEDESANGGTGLRLEALDTAIDTAIDVAVELERAKRKAIKEAA